MILSARLRSLLLVAAACASYQLSACSSSTLMQETPDAGSSGSGVAGSPSTAAGGKLSTLGGAGEADSGAAGEGTDDTGTDTGGSSSGGASGSGFSGGGNSSSSGAAAGGTSAGSTSAGSTSAGSGGKSGANGGAGAGGKAGASGGTGNSAGTGGTAGSAAGTGGTGGVAGGAASCGNNVIDPGEVCDHAFTVNDCGADCKAITSSACDTCENLPSTLCQEFLSCDTVSGSAAAGSPAAGVARKALCNEVLDCVRDSGCAADGNAPIKCYCGSAVAADCQAGLGNGQCRAQLERGLETTTFATISQRIGNVTFGGGLAMSRIDCDQTFCSDQCF